MNYLKKLAAGGSSSDNSSEKCAKGLTVSERLQCCIVAFKVMRSNLDALNVDLQGFFVQLYNLILEYRPGRFVLCILDSKTLLWKLYAISVSLRALIKYVLHAWVQMLGHRTMIYQLIQLMISLRNGLERYKNILLLSLALIIMLFWLVLFWLSACVLSGDMRLHACIQIV
jgi:hypothetical protein